MGIRNAYFIINDYFDEPALNMAYDEFLFEKCLKQEITKPALRIYGWKFPFCSYGFAQKIKNNPEILKKYRDHIVRRPTGGGFVFHNNDISYTLISKVDFHKSFSDMNNCYLALHEALIFGLKELNSDLQLFSENNKKLGDYNCFEDPVIFDIMLLDNKIVGGAQKRRKGFFLHQGTISLPEFDINNKNFEFLYYVGELIKKAFEEYFCFRFSEYKFTDHEEKEVRLLWENKYTQNFWNMKR
ncbi:biotin/lipoate A/B protein ligase family protein [bacterium]